MKTISYFTMSLLIYFVASSCSDDNLTKSNTIDTKGLDYYIQNSEKLISLNEPTEEEWNQMFETPFYKLLLENGYYTKEDIKQELRHVCQDQLTPDEVNYYAHHLEYQQNFTALKAYSIQLHDGTIRDKVYQYLSPFLPSRLQNKNNIPTIYYVYNLSEEAYGLEDQILQDGLLAYKVDHYSKGILTAHEAFHSVATTSLKKRKKVSLSNSDYRKTLIEVLEGISQEGIADLIDKPTLGQTDSPVYNLVQAFTLNEESISIDFINELNQRLENLAQNPSINNPSDFKNAVMAFAGHQPGRYMGKAIQQAGLLNSLIVDVENPFKFFYMYNNAAIQLGGNRPQFSSTALNFLQIIENQVIKPL